MVNIRFAGCESDTLVPCATIVKFPVGVLLAVEKSTGTFEPAATLKGLGGFETTPAGNPERTTRTLPVNPLIAVIERLTAELVAPC